MSFIRTKFKKVAEVGMIIVDFEVEKLILKFVI